MSTHFNDRFPIKLIFVHIVVVNLLGCAQPPLVDFDKYLNSSIGLTLDQTSYDWRHVRLRTKLLISESDSRYTYLYWEENKCSWIIEVSKTNNVVLNWRYSNSDAEKICHNLSGRSV